MQDKNPKLNINNPKLNIKKRKVKLDYNVEKGRFIDYCFELSDLRWLKMMSDITINHCQFIQENDPIDILVSEIPRICFNLTNKAHFNGNEKEVEELRYSYYSNLIRYETADKLYDFVMSSHISRFNTRIVKKYLGAFSIHR